MGTYSLEIGYSDGTKIETKFVIDKIYSSDTGNEGNTGETTEGSTEETTDEDKDKGEKDNTNNGSTDNNNTNSRNNPQTGDNIVLFIVILVVSSIGIIFTTKIKKILKNN